MMMLRHVAYSKLTNCIFKRIFLYMGEVVALIFCILHALNDKDI